MAKKRVHELAKELKIESKELIRKAAEMGISIKSHMSTLDEGEIEQITRKITGAKEKPAAEGRAKKERKPEKHSKGEKRKEQVRAESKEPQQATGRGPGIVDKVPSRPPDRRFTDKPKAKGGGKQQKQRRPFPKQEERKRQERPRADKAADAKPAGRPPKGGKYGKPHGKGRPIDKIKAAEKAKPDVTRAQEKVRAQERAKQFEKQAYRETAKHHKDKFPEWKEEESKVMPIPAPKKGGGEEAESVEKQPAPRKKEITVPESVTVKELAEKMGLGASEIIKKLMQLGVMATINQEIDADTAVIIGEEFNVKVNIETEEDEETSLFQEPEDDEADLVPRPCVVTVMGHVDHGKTSLLDAIRKTKVTASEAGGITQHIGAYQVKRNGQKITFLDTPGHEAFTAMRARGAKVTDLVILVVAADDGVMPQTIEAINHAKAADIPIIVAINKIDKHNAEPDRVKRELTEHGLVPEEWGGETICVPVSAIRGEGLDELLEMILLVAEMLELKANPNRLARGTVIEAELDKGRGPVATVLVQNGTLKVGDAIVAGTVFGKVRAMIDHKGTRVKEAGPSVPVEVLGFSEVPEVGEPFIAVQDEKKARQISERRQARKREEEFKAATPRISLDDLFDQIQEGQVKELNIIIKADVQGSVEALKTSLEKLSTDEVKVKIIHGGVGGITESDIMLASASNAIIIGFNVRPDANARKVAETEKVDIRLYRVIYEVIDDVKKAISGMLEPEYKEVVLGRAEVRKIFKVSKVGTIAGCYVIEGKIIRDAGVRLIRDGVVIYEGKLDSLKRFKDDVKEVVQNYECGLTLEKFNDIQEGDIVEAYTMQEIKRELA